MLLALLLALAGEVPAPRMPLPIHGDFDRDGRRDVARVVQRPSGRYAIEVARASQPSRATMVFNFPNIEGFELRRAKRGIVATACGKGLGRTSEPCPRKTVHVSGDVIEFGFAEASLALAVWNGKTFEVAGISG